MKAAGAILGLVSVATALHLQARVGQSPAVCMQQFSWMGTQNGMGVSPCQTVADVDAQCNAGSKFPAFSIIWRWLNSSFKIGLSPRSIPPFIIPHRLEIRRVPARGESCHLVAVYRISKCATVLGHLTTFSARAQRVKGFLNRYRRELNILENVLGLTNELDGVLTLWVVLVSLQRTGMFKFS